MKWFVFILKIKANQGSREIELLKNQNIQTRRSKNRVMENRVKRGITVQLHITKFTNFRPKMAAFSLKIFRLLFTYLVSIFWKLHKFFFQPALISLNWMSSILTLPFALLMHTLKGPFRNTTIHLHYISQQTHFYFFFGEGIYIYRSWIFQFDLTSFLI